MSSCSTELAAYNTQSKNTIYTPETKPTENQNGKKHKKGQPIKHTQI